MYRLMGRDEWPVGNKGRFLNATKMTHELTCLCKNSLTLIAALWILGKVGKDKITHLLRAGFILKS